MARRVTIKTIADAVGVTHGTVSRALRGDERVRPETAEAIREVAQKLGYRPSRVGRALKTQKTGTLALVVSYLADPFYSEVVQAVHDRLYPLEYSLVMAGTEHDLARQTTVARSFADSMIDGVFVCCLPGFTQPFQELSRKIPVVTINCDPAKHAFGVVHDDHQAMVRVVEFLRTLGHQEIGYLGAVTGGYAERVRAEAFGSLASAQGFKASVRQATDVKVDSGERALTRWLAETPSSFPSALICFNDAIALGALKACRALGVKVPTDLSIVGFDDIEMASFVQPMLTTFAQPRYEMGRAAADLMLGLLNGESGLSGKTFLGQLKLRESTTRA